MKSSLPLGLCLILAAAAEEVIELELTHTVRDRLGQAGRRVTRPSRTP